MGKHQVRLSALRDFDAAFDRFGSKHRIRLLGRYVSSGQLRTYGRIGLGPGSADIVAKVPNCPTLIFLLLKNPTDDR